MPEFNIKQIQTQITEGFDALKKTHERHEQEIKKFGEASTETKTQLDKINTDLTALKNQLDDFATKQNRIYTPGGAEPQTPEQKAAIDAFYKFLRQGKSGLGPDQRKALVEDAEGQIIVPEELDNEIYRELPKLTLFRSLVRVRPTGSDRVRRRSMSEVIVGWGKLETNNTKKIDDFESDLNPGEDWLHVENLNGLVKIGTDELEDTDLNLQTYLSDSFAIARGEAEDAAILIGKGHAFEQPEGILVNSQIGRIPTAGVGAVHFDDLIALMYGVPAPYRKNGTFVMPSILEQMCRTIKNDSGDYIWQPTLTAGTPNTLLGKPTYTQDDFDDFAAGKDQAVFGSFREGYTLLDRKGTSIQRLNEKYIEDDLIGFKFKARVGGGVVRPKAFKVLQIKA